MTNYLHKKFSVPAGGTDAYRENWERTFRGEATVRVVSVTVEAQTCPVCKQQVEPGTVHWLRTDSAGACEVVPQ